jgi:hypothetical protein
MVEIERQIEPKRRILLAGFITGYRRYERYGDKDWVAYSLYLKHQKLEIESIVLFELAKSY